MTQSPNHSAYFMTGLQRGLQVLEILGAADEPMSLSMIAQQLGLSRSSAFRVVYTLRQMDFLKEADQKSTYTLGSRVLNLGFAYLHQQPITELARKHLTKLRDATEISAHLSVLDDNVVLYLDSHQARSGFVSNMTTGTRVEAYASAIGWCLLSSFSDAELKKFCKGLNMKPITKQTPVNFKQLQARVEDIKQKGYVVSRGVREPGGSSIAVPIIRNDGRVAACVNISGPDSGFDFARIEELYLRETQKTALNISRELGYC